MLTVERSSLADIQAATTIVIDNISDHDRDEMAIPSYLHSNPLIRWLMWRRYDTIATMLTPSKDKTALEFGCGIGLFLPHLSRHYGTIYAVDLFPQYAQCLAARKQIAVTFIDSVDNLHDEYLDVIVAADVLEHIEDLENYLSVFKRKLKIGGQFVVSGPTENLIYKAGRILAGFGDKGDYHHTNIDKLILAIKAAGFKQADVKSLPFGIEPSLFKICHFTNPAN